MNPMLQKILESLWKTVLASVGGALTGWLIAKGVPDAFIEYVNQAMAILLAAGLTAIPFLHTIVDKWLKSRKKG